MDGLFKNNAYRILEVFIEYPAKNFSVRGMARALKINHATVLKYVADLKKNGFIKTNDNTLYPTFYANTENEKYKLYKKNYIIFKLKESGLTEHIQKQNLPSSIVLFGSSAKGTFTESSDIDIFIEAKKSGLNLTKYEKLIGKKINILFEPNINNLSSELKNNIINGIILYGFVKIR